MCSTPNARSIRLRTPSCKATGPSRRTSSPSTKPSAAVGKRSGWRTHEHDNQPMNEITKILVNHGGRRLIIIVLIEQLGLPLPAAPWLLAAGALSTTGGKLHPLLAIAVTALACLIADSNWFYLGRHRGSRVLNFLCRISLEPDSCVRRTQNLFTRYGMRGVLAAKFLPGVN